MKMKESNWPLFIFLGTFLTLVFYFQYFSPGRPEVRCQNAYGSSVSIKWIYRTYMCELPDGSLQPIPNH